MYGPDGCVLVQADPLRPGHSLSRGGSVESLSVPGKTHCLTSSDNKRMSADLSELRQDDKMPFSPGNARTPVAIHTFVMFFMNHRFNLHLPAKSNFLVSDSWETNAVFIH